MFSPNVYDFRTWSNIHLIHGNSDPLALDKNTEGLGHH